MHEEASAQPGQASLPVVFSPAERESFFGSIARHQRVVPSGLIGAVVFGLLTWFPAVLLHALIR